MTATPAADLRARYDAIRAADAQALEGEPWDAPVPLTAAAPPPFPTDCLPEPFRSFVEATSAASNTTPDLLGPFVLPVLATVVAGRWNVTPWPGWTEPTTLHVVVVAPPGSMKSKAVHDAAAPLVTLEAELAARYGPEVAQAATQRRIDEGRLKRLEGEAASAKNPAAAREALDLASHLANTPPPVVPRIYTTDATPEALEKLLAAHGERFGWIDAEGGLFTMAAGRYSSKGAGVNVEVLTKGHAADTLKVDRVGREPVTLTAPSLTIGICVQPDVFRSAALNLELSGRGLLARQLVAWPALEPVDRSTGPGPDAAHVADAYAARVVALYRESERIPAGAARTLTVDPDALEALREWFGWTSAAQRNGGELTGIAAWAAKLDGASVRLAGVLTLAADPSASSVNLGAATRAIGLARYFTAHALHAFGEVGIRDDVRHARTCLAAIQRGRPSADQWREWPGHVSTRDVHASVRRTADLERADDVRQALLTLADHGYLRLAPAPEGKGRGRPAERWALNPAAIQTEAA